MATVGCAEYSEDAFHYWSHGRGRGDKLDEGMIGKRIRMCSLAVEFLARQLGDAILPFASVVVFALSPLVCRGLDHLAATWERIYATPMRKTSNVVNRVEGDKPQNDESTDGEGGELELHEPLYLGRYIVAATAAQLTAALRFVLHFKYPWKARPNQARSRSKSVPAHRINSTAAPVSS